jgi:hypothetical protein
MSVLGSVIPARASLFDHKVIEYTTKSWHDKQCATNHRMQTL